MASRLRSESNAGLVQQLQDSGVIKKPIVAEVMKQTDRKHYCRVANPYVDQPESIGCFATISAPHMHAFALENLSEVINADSKILDIGAGSGYLTACFARLIEAKAKEKNTEPTGIVIAIEHQPDLVKFANENIKNDDYKLISDERLKIIQGDGRIGCIEYGPYDVIHVGAAASETPLELLLQLKTGGRMLCPVGPQDGEQNMEQYDKKNSGEVVKDTLTSVMYVPLTDLKV
ncbi:hypothetical protein PVAND_016352 [Polypedilum vanderplanki]|uniref:protein-L-isoaspartate(D-aspartate) O-methyltransferase n=1 Tax=Polypedilum vanderplanki TaxID=319348 RepID=S6CDF7_POLVA|nr:hypothetical protein PVAND_016352 [Polypedilum vanderplanki]BAN67565.1 protein L-isoaspartyl methyltransferase [Polypedilum vanderplanki]